MMFVRIELMDPDDFDLSLKKLRACFPKVENVYFPFKNMKGGSTYGFSFHKTDLLLDWTSISKWCLVESATNYESDCCNLLCSPKAVEVLTPCIPVMASLIRSKREFSCDLSFVLAKRKSQLELKLIAEDDRLAVLFELCELLGGHAKTTEVMNRVWSSATKKFPPLKQAAVSFEDRIKFAIPTKSDSLCTTKAGVKLTVSGSAGIKTALKKAFELTMDIREWFEDWHTSFSSQLTPDEAPKIAKAFDACCDDATIHFDGTYHPKFHPDQVREEFPLEGFWQLPLFEVRFGRQFYEMFTFQLVQTPKERFFELELSGAEELAKLKQWLKPKKALQIYDGPTNKRWDLHKLRKTN
jgi:hypothetical protein